MVGSGGYHEGPLTYAERKKGLSPFSEGVLF